MVDQQDDGDADVDADADDAAGAAAAAVGAAAGGAGVVVADGEAEVVEEGARDPAYWAVYVLLEMAVLGFVRIVVWVA